MEFFGGMRALVPRWCMHIGARVEIILPTTRTDPGFIGKTFPEDDCAAHKKVLWRITFWTFSPQEDFSTMMPRRWIELGPNSCGKSRGRARRGQV